MRNIILNHPNKLVFGNDSINNFVEDVLAKGLKKLLVVTASPIFPLIQPAIDRLISAKIDVIVDDGVLTEPTIKSFSMQNGFSTKIIFEIFESC